MELFPLITMRALELSVEEIARLDLLRKRHAAGELDEETPEYRRLLFVRVCVERHVFSDAAGPSWPDPVPSDPAARFTHQHYDELEHRFWRDDE